MNPVICVIGVWCAGMIGYIALDKMKSTNCRHRCNVKNEIISFKKINKEMNSRVSPK